MNNITPEQIAAWSLCYDIRYVRDLFGSRQSASLREIMGCEGVLGGDRIWVACRALPLPVVQALAETWAERAIRRAVEATPETETGWHEWARGWLSGEDRSEAAAWAAEPRASGDAEAASRVARAAVWAASASGVARSVAIGVAVSAAEAAACVMRRAALRVGASAEAAAWVARDAEAVERRAQIADVMAVIETT
jgi:hypothetical protein